MKQQVSIIGGGIAGLTTAIALNKTGINTIIFEAAPAIKAVGAGIGLGANAIIAFKRLGMMDEAVALGNVLPAFTIYDEKGTVITRTDSKKMSAKYGIDNFTIHRAALHELLLSKVDAKTIFTNKKAIDIVQQENSVVIKFEDGTSYETASLIVADGIHSPIRKKLVPGTEPRHAGVVCWRAVIDNTHLNLTETSETWGADGRFGIVPLGNNKIYWFACINAKPNNSQLKKYTINDIQQHFKYFHAPIPAILNQTRNESLLCNDIIDLKPIHQYAFNNVLLIGDAAHATTPNMGQGACQAIEDAVVLADELQKSTDVKQAFINFEKRRLARTHYITNTSWKIGKVAQLENKLLIGLRNFIFRLLPATVNEKQLEKLYEVDF